MNRIVRIAAFQNPEFYAAQAMRLPTFSKPRIISRAELFAKHVALPRGCLGDLLDLLADLGIATEPRDERQSGRAAWGAVPGRTHARTGRRGRETFSGTKPVSSRRPRRLAKPSLPRR